MLLPKGWKDTGSRYKHFESNFNAGNKAESLNSAINSRVFVTLYMIFRGSRLHSFNLKATFRLLKYRVVEKQHSHCLDFVCFCHIFLF